jgi:hypothetical protein
LTVQSRAEFFRTGEGEFFFGLYLLEKSVVASQAARSSNETHQNVLRTSLFTEAFGQPLATGAVVEGTIKGFMTTYTLPANYNVGNLTIAGIIWRKNGARYEVVNVNWTDKISASVTSVQDVRLLQGFQIWPNVLTEQAQVRIQLPANAGIVHLDIYDMQGRRIQTLFQGRLAEGEHQFLLNRSAIPASGQYVLRLRAGKAQASRLFIAQ